MIMFNVLLNLFRIANILAVALMLISYVLTVVAKVRKSTLATSKIVFPIFGEQHTMIKHCFWSGSLFILLCWLLCSSSMLPTDGSPLKIISESLLTFGLIWSIMLFLGIITEVVLKCIKNGGSFTASVVDGIKSTIWYAVIYFVCSFLIA